MKDEKECHKCFPYKLHGATVEEYAFSEAFEGMGTITIAFEAFNLVVKAFTGSVWFTILPGVLDV